MTGADFTCVHPIIAKVLVCDVSIFIPDQSIRLDCIWVELDLYFGVPSHRNQGPGNLVAKYPVGLILRVNVVVVAITLVGQQG